MPSDLYAQLTVTADITENTTWTVANSPVTVDATITVIDGVTLTIDPGVSVQMTAGTSLLVEGALISDGTVGSPVLFTSSSGTPGPGDWGSIEFRNSGDVGSVINYTTIEYGAGADRTGMIFYITGAFGVDISNSVFRNSAVHGINLRASNSTITDSEFYDNAGYGIFTDLSLGYEVQNSVVRDNGIGGIRVPLNSGATINGNNIEANPVGILIDNGGLPTITNNQIINNDVGIRVIEVGATKPVITDNTISGNANFGAENLGSNILDARFNFWGSSLGPTVDSNPSGTGDRITDNVEYAPWRFGATDLPVIEVNSNITTNATWSQGNVYHVLNNISINTAATLTIEAGTIVKFASGVTLTVSGNLSSNGTAGNLVIFTSERDDAAGGDTNGDGDATTPAPNNWGVINIENTSSSSIAYSLIRYGGSASNNGVLYLNSATVLSNIVVSQSSGNGIYATVDQTLSWTQVASVDNTGNGVYLFEVAADFKGGNLSLNGGHGLYARSSTVEKLLEFDFVTIDRNGANGVFVDILTSREGTRISLMQNSEITNNNQSGVLHEFSETGPQTYLNNTIEGNGGFGINLSHGQLLEDVLFEGNTVLNNGEAGILSSRATFIDNTFEGNRFGIGAWKRLGHIYTDGSGVDGNVFTDNTYPNAIALYANSLDGVLSNVVPASFPNPTYVLASTGTANSSANSLVISPGVTVKAARELVDRFSTINLRFEGLLLAEGSEESPIVFTSLYDHEYGGDVSRVDDTTAPSPGNWFGVELNDGGTSGSVLANVIIRYGVTNLSVGDLNSGSSAGPVEYVNTFTDLWVDNASGSGLYGNEALFTVERLRATDNGNNGVLINDANNGNTFVARAIIRNSEITGNGGTNTNAAGLLSSSSGNGAAFPEISNTLISGNSIGVRINGSSIPVTLQFNTIENNNIHGVFARLIGIDTEETFTISGNTISGHTSGTGAIVTRAIITDNIFENNQFPVGLMGELSVATGPNENGTVFSGNTIGEHLYSDAIALYSENNLSLNGKLGFTWPESYTNGVYVPIVGTTYINGSNSVDIAPGTVFKLGHNSGNDSFFVGGVLNANGLTDNKIIFTSIRDDSFAGDTNKDENATLPARSNWRWLEFRGANSSESLMNNVIVRYGDRNLYIDNSEMVFDNSFSSNANYGIYTISGALPTIRNSEIHSNRFGILVASSSNDPNIHLNNIYDNDDAGLWVDRNVTAIDNYWGDSTGPFVDQGPDLNLDGQGDRIFISGSNQVTYRPFLTDRTGVLLGDVSENGDISAFDASLVLQYVVDLITLEATQLSASDVSGDGTVSAMDASFILQYVVGIISGFPGAGKRPDIEIQEIYEIETIITDSFYDLIIRTKGKMDIYAGKLKLNYPESSISFVELMANAATGEWSDVRNLTDGQLSWAVAGVQPVEDEADLFHIRFHLVDGQTPEADQFAISGLIMNELDLTAHAGESFSEQIEANQIPDIFSLQQNFPNPFNPATSIKYKLPVSGEVSVRIFNSIGQQVAVLVNSESQTAGSYQLEWNALNVASGVYFYRIDVSGENGRAFTDVKRMTLIK